MGLPRKCRCGKAADEGHTLCPLCRLKQRERNWKRKIEALNAYGGCRCVCCGETDVHFLTIDHVNRDGKVHRASMGIYKAGVGMYTWLKRQGYPHDTPLQVLCFNCNQGREANNGVCPHQCNAAALLPNQVAAALNNKVVVDGKEYRA